ncbi:dTMP kinase [Streptomyces sp. NPDC005551]|uniref:dTMP kinase n=1 Tax=unclassified Streptomyces TaxID=2593676 RepID=UPI0033FE6DD8
MTQQGLFVSLDGPSGVGKSTTIEALHRELTGRGVAVHQTAEPSQSKLGTFTRENANEIHGRALACLVMADRYAHIEHDIRPSLATGDTVICDRYIASTLVLQRLDGVPLDFLLALNDDVLPPDLAVILTASPGRITDRIAKRGVRHRFHLDPTLPGREVELYVETARLLKARNVRVLVLDTSNATPSDAASAIADALPAPSVPSATTPKPTTPQGT